MGLTRLERDMRRAIDTDDSAGMARALEKADELLASMTEISVRLEQLSAEKE